MSYLKITIRGSKYWYNDEGHLHREDGPAIECIEGYKYWYINGKIHREDGTAIELSDGTKYWYLNDKRHREDGPAVEYIDGNKSWWYYNYFIGSSYGGFAQKDFERYLRSLNIKEYR